MDIWAWIFLGLIIFVFVAAIVMLYMMLNDISNNAIYKKMKEKGDIAVKSALNTYCNTKNYEQCVFELELVFNEIILMNDKLRSEYTNIAVVLKKHILDINAGLIAIKDIDVDSYKKVVHDLLKEYNSKNPLEQIKGADYIVLKQILECIDTNDIDKGKEIVNQLALQLKTLQDSNMEKEKNSRRQDAIAKLGIVLSVVFGIMTFVQFFI